MDEFNVSRDEVARSTQGAAICEKPHWDVQKLAHFQHKIFYVLPIQRSGLLTSMVGIARPSGS